MSEFNTDNSNIIGLNPSEDDKSSHEEIDFKFSMDILKQYIDKRCQQCLETSAVCQKKVEDNVNEYIQSTIKKYITSVASSIIKDMTHIIIDETKKAIIQGLNETLNNNIIPLITANVEKSFKHEMAQLSKEIDRSLRAQCLNHLIPSFEKSCDEMLNQISSHFRSGIESYRQLFEHSIDNIIQDVKIN